jgi:IclR family transcriptional regulator, acetate operon repressor
MAKIVNSTKRALDILELFTRYPDGLSVSEISKIINAPMSSCVDLIYTLEQKEYLTRLGNQKRYMPTGKLFYLGRQFATRNLLHQSEQHLTELHQQSGETCVLSCLAEGRVTVINARESIYPLRYSANVGQTLPFHITASGKSVLAEMSAEQFRETLAHLRLRSATDNTITRKSDFLKEMELTKSRGWAASVEEAYPGILSLATGFRIEGQIYAISVVGPLARINEHKERYVGLLLDIRKRLQT